MSDTILKWQDSKITEAFVSKSAGGENYAVLKADPAKAASLGNLQRDLFEKNHLLSYPKTIDGEHCLVVHGFDKIEQLENALGGLEATSGQPNIDKLKEAPQTIAQKWDSFRHNGALKMSGFSGLAGHGLMAVQGFGEEARWDINKIPECIAKGVESKMIMSLLYMVNSGLYAYYGNGDRGLQTDETLAEMHKFLQKSGLDLEKTPYDELVKKYEHDKPFAKKLNDFVADNLITINESIGLLCNTGMIKNGVQNRDFGLVTAGSAAIVGSLTAMFVEEKPMAEQDPEMLATPWGKAWAWVQNSPMMVNGASNWINSASLFLDPPKRWEAVEKGVMHAEMLNDAGDAYVKGKYNIDEVHQHYSDKLQEQKAALGNNQWGTPEYTAAEKALGKTQSELDNATRHQNFVEDEAKSWQIPTAMSAFYVAATFFSTVSSKEKAVSEDPYEQYAELLTRAAQMAMNAPEGKERDKAVYLMSASLAANPDVKGLNANDINAHINKEIDDLQQNPFNSVGKSERIIAANKIVPLQRKPESQIALDSQIDVSRLQSATPELVRL